MPDSAQYDISAANAFFILEISIKGKVSFTLGYTKNKENDNPFLITVRISQKNMAAITHYTQNANIQLD